MNFRRLPCLLLLALLAHPGHAQAQVRWREMPPEDRQYMRQQMRDHWEQERSDRQEAEAPRWREMPPEDRRRMREEMRDHSAWSDFRSERVGSSGPPPGRGGGRGWR